MVYTIQTIRFRSDVTVFYTSSARIACSELAFRLNVFGTSNTCRWVSHLGVFGASCVGIQSRLPLAGDIPISMCPDYLSTKQEGVARYSLAKIAVITVEKAPNETHRKPNKPCTCRNFRRVSVSLSQRPTITLESCDLTHLLPSSFSQKQASRLKLTRLSLEAGLIPAACPI